MDASAISQIIFLIILLIFSAFFSSAETALTTVNKIRMRTLADDGNKRAERVLRITDDSHKMLSAILIGNNIVNLSASSLATTLAIKLWGSVGAGIATGILTFLILVFGEISPNFCDTLCGSDFDRLFRYHRFSYENTDSCDFSGKSVFHGLFIFYCIWIQRQTTIR